MYRRGLLRLFPPARRARLADVMTKAGHALHLWMMTKIVAMAASKYPGVSRMVDEK
jgi:hypothetical protein